MNKIPKAIKVSIITAVYNRAATVGQAIRSVQQQRYPNIEHIIQDGGSSDGTLAVIKQMESSQTFTESAPDDGIYDAINKGIARSTGDVIGLVHSDDFLASKDVIKSIAKAFEDPAVDAVYGDLDYISSVDSHKVIRRWKSSSFEPSHLALGWMPPHPTLYLRREVFQKFGTYDATLRISADYDAILRFFKIDGFNSIYLPQVLVKMRIGGESNSSMTRILRKSKEDLRALRRNQVGGIGTLMLKNVSKVKQFIEKG